MPRVVVLRLGHRVGRDERITTHVGLAARAFGADEIIIAGDRDDAVVGSINNVSQQWGGSFKASYTENWVSLVKEWKNNNRAVVHLTMYGLPLQQVIQQLRLEQASRDMLVIVGGPKVRAETYRLADYNVAVTNQPHSEVAALAVFLDWLFAGRELEKIHEGGRMRIIPQPRGKKVVHI